MKKYDGVLQKVHQIEEKYGIKYATPDGSLYKGVRVAYTLAFVWALVMNLLFILGFLTMYLGTENFSDALKYIITVSVCSVVLIAGFVLNRFKLYLTSGILSILSAVLLLPVFATQLTDDLGFLGFKFSFYWRHAVPLLLIVLLMTWLTIIALRSKIKLDKEYKRVVENLFNEYNVSNAKNVSAEQWEEFLSGYNPKDYSNKKAKQKHDEE